MTTGEYHLQFRSSIECVLTQNAKKIFGSKKWFVKYREEEEASNERERYLSIPRPRAPQSISKHKGRPGGRVSSSATIHTKDIPSRSHGSATQLPKSEELLGS